MLGNKNSYSNVIRKKKHKELCLLYQKIADENTMYYGSKIIPLQSEKIRRCRPHIQKKIPVRKKVFCSHCNFSN